jgi:hypothetical protein
MFCEHPDTYTRTFVQLWINFIILFSGCYMDTDSRDLTNGNRAEAFLRLSRSPRILRNSKGQHRIHTSPYHDLMHIHINPLMPELNPSAQRCLTRYFTRDFASWIVHFVNICVKKQQMQQLFIQFINYVFYLLHVLALHCHPQGVFLVPSQRCSIEKQSIEYTSLDTTRQSTIFYRLILNWASLRRH